MNLTCAVPALLLSMVMPALFALPLKADGELAWSVRYDPRTLDPAKVDDQVSETVRNLTGGVLLRLNRRTQTIEPALAASWTLSPDGKLLTFHLRPDLHFSDGSPLTSADVVATLRRVLDPATSAPVAEEFISPKDTTVQAPDPLTVLVHLARRVVGIGKVFDEIAIQPAAHQGDTRITAGSYTVVGYNRGESLHLLRNPFYFKRDSRGVQLPYIAALRLDILGNREQDQLRFLHGEYHVLESISPESFNLLATKAPQNVHDLGPSLNTEQLWFNQSAAAPIPDYEKKWFSSRRFRAAVSAAIHRDDLARIAFDGHATPANGFISPSNRLWYNRDLPPARQDSAAALDLLAADGFRKQGATLVDAAGHPVRFSILTNAGNRARTRMAALIQQDLAAVGIEVNVVTLDFPALIERLMHTQSYEAAMLGLTDVEPDPSSMTNIWLSSSPNHQWNPSEKTPATPWEAEVDREMLLQAEAPNDVERKRHVDRVQTIVAEQLPFIFLVFPDTLVGYSPLLTGVELSALQPGVVFDIDRLHWNGAAH